LRDGIGSQQGGGSTDELPTIHVQVGVYHSYATLEDRYLRQTLK
jgi:hypothetical protein